MTSFILKIIALVAMFCDHFGDAYLKHFSILNLIGRCAFPLFAFQISEGFVHTKNIKKYFFRLGIFALISQIPFSLFMYKFFRDTSFSLNVFFTLFLGLLAIYLYNYINKLLNKLQTSIKTDNNNSSNKYVLFSKIVGIIIVLLIAFIAELFNTDYGSWGVLLVFTFYSLRNHRILRIIVFTLLVLIKYISPLIQTNFNIVYILMFLATLLPILFIDLYNGKQCIFIIFILSSTFTFIVFAILN